MGASNQVAICHATGSAANPYVLIHPVAAGVVDGHLEHQDARDIIPPFVYKGVTYPQNWTAAGKALSANGCAGELVTPPDDGDGSF